MKTQRTTTLSKVQLKPLPEQQTAATYNVRWTYIPLCTAEKMDLEMGKHHHRVHTLYKHFTYTTVQ